jgi:hypothetical protein
MRRPGASAPAAPAKLPAAPASVQPSPAAVPTPRPAPSYAVPAPAPSPPPAPPPSFVPSYPAPAAAPLPRAPVPVPSRSPAATFAPTVSPAAPSATYAPYVRSAPAPAVSSPAARPTTAPLAPYAPPPAQPVYVPAPAQPSYAPPPAQPVYVPARAQPSYAPPPPAQPFYPPPPYFLPEPFASPSIGASPAASRAAAAAATPTIAAARPATPRAPHRTLGIGLDVGMPDGANLGLVLSPASWLRLGAAVGTNSASFGYRGGLALVPVGWGPSLSLEAGHCNLAAPTDLIRYFFSVPTWVKPYVQKLGYTYFNAHLGFDLVLGSTTLYLHGGYTYLMGTVRATQSVVVDKTSNTKVTLGQDGEVRAHTLSAKLGLIYMFGGS